MTDEYTPTTEEIRERWMEFDGGPDPDDANEFDRWLAEVRAKAWDEGARAKDIEWAETWDIVTPDEDRFQAVNPYREGA